MSEAQLTLLAAVIAAAASIISLLGNIFSAWQGELRASHRTVLLPHLPEISSIIEILFKECSQYLNEVQRGAVNQDSLKKAQDAAARLDTVRVKIKYQLWGIDPALEALVKLPAWMRDWANDPPALNRLLQSAIQLKNEVDDIIRRSYLSGRPPTYGSVWRVRSIAARITRSWGQTSTR